MLHFQRPAGAASPLAPPAGQDRRAGGAAVGRADRAARCLLQPDHHDGVELARGENRAAQGALGHRETHATRLTRASLPTHPRGDSPRTAPTPLRRLRDTPDASAPQHRTPLAGWPGAQVSVSASAARARAHRAGRLDSASRTAGSGSLPKLRAEHSGIGRLARRRAAGALAPLALAAPLLGSLVRRCGLPWAVGDAVRLLHPPAGQLPRRHARA